MTQCTEIGFIVSAEMPPQKGGEADVLRYYVNEEGRITWRTFKHES